MRDVITRSEIESLIFVREKQYEEWRQHRKSIPKPSDWCIQKLGMREVKSRAFLTEYWEDADQLVEAITQYTSMLGSHKRDQLNLCDLLK